MTYIINNWDKYFEISESRRHTLNKWLPLPNKMDGLSYRRLTMSKDKHVVFTCWILLIQLASKMPKRGVLENETGSLDFEDMEIMTGFPAKSFELAIRFLESPKIGWIGHNGQSQSALRASSEIATTTVHNTTEQNNTEQNNTIPVLVPSEPFLIGNEIITFLNQISNKTYKATTKKTKSLITARLNEGFTLENFKTVIFKKVQEWTGTEFEKYLTPDTLFSNKFEKYLNQTGTTNQGKTRAEIADDNLGGYLASFMDFGKDKPQNPHEQPQGQPRIGQ